jgi:hypothetical protein
MKNIIFKMTREEFVKWFAENACFSKESESSDVYWRNLVDYADYIFDYVEIESDKVIYKWEELYWGGSSYENREFTFEEFVEAYKNDSIK